MYAIVRTGNGQYYMSTVFGYYNKAKDKWDYNHRYWVVWDRDKTALVNQNALEQGIEYLVPMVLIVDSDQHDWVLDDDNANSLAILPTEQLFDMIETDTVPTNILQQCIDLDKEYAYNPYPEIVSEKDINDFAWVSGRLHDAYISDIEENGDSLYVMFDGVWGCRIEMWFEGDVSYDTSSRTLPEYDQYWMDSTVIIQDGYVYLIDDCNVTVENACEGWCWFKASHMKYHVIPR